MIKDKNIKEKMKIMLLKVILEEISKGMIKIKIMIKIKESNMLIVVDNMQKNKIIINNKKIRLKNKLQNYFIKNKKNNKKKN